MFNRRGFLMGSVALSSVALATSAAAKPFLLRRDPLIEGLLRRMTLEEKAGQLSIFTAVGGAPINPAEGLNPSAKAVLAQVRDGLTTGYLGSFDVAYLRSLQKIAVEESRLKIPLIFAADVIHGLKTVYPIPLGEAASFDVELCRRTARATAQEASGFGVHWTFAPMVDVARDQRWGRVAEGAGEDPWLGSRIAEARVRGFQGEDLKAEGSLLSCPKHFAGYGAVQGGMDYNTAEISEVTLRQVHLPPFKAAFDAGALTTMSSFNDINGVPSTGSRRLLTEILRDEWRFGGLVVSDFMSDKELIDHGFAADDADAALKALWAGCDISMQSGLYLKHVPALVRSGRLSEKVVDEAVRRVLGVKKAIGLFDNPYRALDPARRAKVEGTADMIALAREAGRKSIVLLKNDDAILPLAKTGKAIAFIGPFVSNKANEFGAWAYAGDTSKTVSLQEAVRNALGPDAQVTFTEGCKPTRPIDGGLEAAKAAALRADIAVVYVGELSSSTGEAASTISITLPAPQQALVEAVAATGKPVVVLLKHGRALALSGAVTSAKAIVCTWFLGSQSGNAIADVLFGDFAPQGRLPVSFPRASGQEPFYYNHRPTGRPQTDAMTMFKARYTEEPNQALFPFGHGLGYSRIDYGKTEAAAPTMARKGSVKVRATVTNAGSRAQHEVAQLYVHLRTASITQPVRVLRGVQHLDLEPGTSAVVEFEVAAEDLGYVHADLRESADPGVVDLWVAPSAVAGQAATLTVI